MILAIRRMVNQIKGLGNSGEELLKTPPEGYENVPPQYCSTCDAPKPPAFYAKKVKTDSSGDKRKKRRHDRSAKLGKLFSRKESAPEEEPVPSLNEPKDQVQIFVKCSACLSPMVLPPKGAQSTYQQPLPDQSQDEENDDNSQSEQPSHKRDTNGESSNNGTKSADKTTGGKKTNDECPSCNKAWPSDATFCPTDGTPRAKTAN